MSDDMLSFDALAERGQYRAFQRAYGKENQASRCTLLYSLSRGPPRLFPSEAEICFETVSKVMYRLCAILKKHFLRLFPSIPHSSVSPLEISDHFLLFSPTGDARSHPPHGGMELRCSRVWARLCFLVVPSIYTRGGYLFLLRACLSPSQRHTLSLSLPLSLCSSLSLSFSLFLSFSLSASLFLSFFLTFFLSRATRNSHAQHAHTHTNTHTPTYTIFGEYMLNSCLTPNPNSNPPPISRVLVSTVSTASCSMHTAGSSSGISTTELGTEHKTMPYETLGH